MTRYTTQDGTYIGQQGRVIASELKKHCNMTPYIRLVNQCNDQNGFVTVRAVEEYDNGRKMIDIGNFLGSVMIPYEAVLFRKED
jgi:hypothetical protein